MKKRSFVRYIAFLSDSLGNTLPCFNGCGCVLPSGDDDTSTAARRAHLEACPVTLQKAALRDRTNGLIAQNPAHITRAIVRYEGV